MKKLFVLVPAILLVLFLLNSFVLKEKDAKKKPVKEGKAAGMTNVIFRSTDGGQTWQDISRGLPERLQRESVWREGVFADEHGLYLRAGDGVYRSDPNSTTPIWTKEIFPGRQRNIAPGKNGMLAYDFRGQFLRKVNGTDNWSPVYQNFQEQAVRLNGEIDWMYTNFKEKLVRAVYETSGGTVFIVCSNSLFRSTNNGKTWKQVRAGDGTMKLVESDGVLLATTYKNGILRSTDDGESWDRVMSEGGAGSAVERIDGGFAAIVNDTMAQRSSIHISMDSGKTWNPIGEALQPSSDGMLMQKIGLIKSSPNILSIKQLGKYLVCGRTDGIFRSSDMGKTWKKLVLPAAENYGCNLSVSGKVMYIMPNKGC